MADNPYEPPKSNIADPEARPAPGSVWKGVLIGALVDIAGTTVVGILLFVVYMMLNASSEMPFEEAEGLGERFAQDAVQLGSVWGLASVLMGFAWSLIGGYVCARFASEHWKVATVILGLAMAAFGMASAAEYYSLGENLGFGLLTLAIVYLGGWLRGGRRPSAT